MNRSGLSCRVPTVTMDVKNIKMNSSAGDVGFPLVIQGHNSDTSVWYNYVHFGVL